MTNFEKRDEAVAKMVAAASDRAGWQNIAEICLRNGDESGVADAERHVTRLDAEFSKHRKAVMEHVYLLILSASSRISRDQSRVDDIASAAAIHVMEKLEQFDPARGNISTFVSRLVIDAAQKHFRQDRLIPVPEKAVAKTEPKTRKERVKADQVNAAMMVGFEDSSDACGLFKSKELSAYEVMENKESLDRLTVAVGKLGKRHADVIRRRFGIGCEPETLLEVAGRYDLSKERARQIEGQAMERLRS